MVVPPGVELVGVGHEVVGDVVEPGRDARPHQGLHLGAVVVGGEEEGVARPEPQRGEGPVEVLASLGREPARGLLGGERQALLPPRHPDPGGSGGQTLSRGGRRIAATP